MMCKRFEKLIQSSLAVRMPCLTLQLLQVLLCSKPLTQWCWKRRLTTNRHWLPKALCYLQLKQWLLQYLQLIQNSWACKYQPTMDRTHMKVYSFVMLGTPISSYSWVKMHKPHKIYACLIAVLCIKKTLINKIFIPIQSKPLKEMSWNFWHADGVTIIVGVLKRIKLKTKEIWQPVSRVYVISLYQAFSKIQSVVGIVTIESPCSSIQESE